MERKLTIFYLLLNKFFQFIEPGEQHNIDGRNDTSNDKTENYEENSRDDLVVDYCAKMLEDSKNV